MPNFGGQELAAITKGMTAGSCAASVGQRLPKCVRKIRSVGSRHLLRLISCIVLAFGLPAMASENPVRVATFNCSLNREQTGQLQQDLAGGGNIQARKVARILRQLRPDIVLLNEFDFDESGTAARTFLTDYLEASAEWAPEAPLHYEVTVALPVNTGVPSSCDLDHDGKTDGPGDAIGFGKFPGQYGMVIFSRFPLASSGIRTFRQLRWKNMPQALLPVSPESGLPWYSDKDLNLLALSSKSHWDVPLLVNSQVVHILASHPTPPAFDGPEDRNGRRNHDEIRFWKNYLTEGEDLWIRDDNGQNGGLPASEQFVILGDLNADPVDGGSVQGAIQQLLLHKRVNSKITPESAGAATASTLQGQANLKHQGNPRQDTADFSDRSVGNLRADYVLPSTGFTIEGSGIFWPAAGEPGAELIDCSDHRLVWVNLVRSSP